MQVDLTHSHVAMFTVMNNETVLGTASVQVLMTSSDVTRACGSYAFMTAAESPSDMGVPGDDTQVLQPNDDSGGPIPVDIESLFKRESRKEDTFHILKAGVGNALKDYQLMSVVGDTEQNPDDQLLNAKRAMQASGKHAFSWAIVMQISSIANPN